MTATTRPTVQLTIRKLDAGTYDIFRIGAKARGLTQAEYLAALLELHHELMDAPANGILEALGLQQVTA